MDTSTPAGELIFHVFGVGASFERKLMLERQREGIAKAKAAGPQIHGPRSVPL